MAMHPDVPTVAPVYVATRNPNVAKAVPMPMARAPNVGTAWWRRGRLVAQRRYGRVSNDYWRGRRRRPFNRNRSWSGRRLYRAGSQGQNRSTQDRESGGAQIV